MSKDMIDGYEKEVQILKQTNHPFIIKYIDSFKNQERKYCIVTQYANGGDIQHYIKNRNNVPLSEEEAMTFFVQILVGVHFLHN